MNIIDLASIQIFGRTIEALITDHPDSVLTPWSGIALVLSEWRSWTFSDLVILSVIMGLDLCVFGMIAYYSIRPAIRNLSASSKAGIWGFFFLSWSLFTFLGLVGQVVVPLLLKNHHGV